MKNILKVLYLIMVLVLSISVFTACKTENPEDALKAAFEKMESLNDFDAGMDMNITMDASGMEVGVSGEMDIKACDVKNACVMSIDGSVTAFNVKQKISAYMADSMFYINVMNNKIKIPLGEGIDITKEGTAETPDISASNLELKEENENKIITGTIKAEEFSKTITDSMKNIGTASDEEILSEIENFDLTDIIFKAVINSDGYISSLDLKFDINFKEASSEISNELSYNLKMDIKIQFNNIGKKPEITAPSDLGSYMSMEEYQNSLMQQYAGLNTGDLEGLEDTDFNLDDFNLDDLE